MHTREQFRCTRYAGGSRTPGMEWYRRRVGVGVVCEGTDMGVGTDDGRG